jgi:HlyD family secretion protein
MNMTFTVPRQTWFAAFGVALLLALGWVATQSGPLAPIEVTVTPVVTGEVSPALFGIGTVEAQRAYLIGPTAAGRVKRVLVDVGDTVKAGQLLAEMEPVDLDTRVASTVGAADRGRSAVAAAEAQERDARSRQELVTSEARRYLALARQESSVRARWMASCRNRSRRTPSSPQRRLDWLEPGETSPGWTPTSEGRNSSGGTSVSLLR